MSAHLWETYFFSQKQEMQFFLFFCKKYAAFKDMLLMDTMQVSRQLHASSSISKTVKPWRCYTTINKV